MTMRFYGLRSNSDLDNAIKMLDAFNGILWIDDRQIVEIHAYKLSNSMESETYIEIEELPELEHD